MKISISQDDIKTIPDASKKQEQLFFGDIGKKMAELIEQNKNTQLALGKLALDLAKKEGK